MNVLQAIIGLTLLGVSQALYSSSTSVWDLDPSQFNSLVIDSDDVWVVTFYAPWCGYSEAMVPAYEKAASALQGVVRFGAVDGDQYRTMNRRHGIRSYPTTKVYGSDKRNPTVYNGARTASGFVETAVTALQAKVLNDVSGDESSESADQVIGTRRRAPRSSQQDAVVELAAAAGGQENRKDPEGYDGGRDASSVGSESATEKIKDNRRKKSGPGCEARP